MGILALIARPRAAGEGEAVPGEAMSKACKCTYCGTEVGATASSCPSCGAMRLSLSPAGIAMGAYASISAGIEQIPLWGVPIALVVCGLCYTIANRRASAARRCIWLKI